MTSDSPPAQFSLWILKTPELLSSAAERSVGILLELLNGLTTLTLLYLFHCPQKNGTREKPITGREVLSPLQKKLRIFKDEEHKQRESRTDYFKQSKKHMIVHEIIRMRLGLTATKSSHRFAYKNAILFNYKLSYCSCV